MNAAILVFCLAVCVVAQDAQMVDEPVTEVVSKDGEPLDDKELDSRQGYGHRPYGHGKFNFFSLNFKFEF
jgi:hypothetical protein